MINFYNNPMQRVFDAMQALVNSPALAFFQSYKNDFEEFDRREICDWGSTSSEWIWAVRENGSRLAQLGLSDYQDEYARAIVKHVAAELAAVPARAKLFHVTGAGQVREISSDGATQLLSKPRRYGMQAGVLVRHLADGTMLPIARSRLVWERGFARAPTATVAFETMAGYQPTAMQRWQDIAVMRSFASDLVVEDTGSLLDGFSKLLVDGHEFEELFLTARQRAFQQGGDTPVPATKRQSTPNNKLRQQPTQQRSTQC